MQTFETEDFDIGFSASFVDASGGEPVAVCPATRVDSHLLPQQGKSEARKAGTLTLTWDNSFSKLRSKKLQYSVVRARCLPYHANCAAAVGHSRGDRPLLHGNL